MSVEVNIENTVFQVEVEATSAPNEVKVTVSNGPKGDPFRYEDFTPEQIEGLKQPATDAAHSANQAADSANSAANSANSAAFDANQAAGAANNAADSANSAAGEANSAADAANQAADHANSQLGWTPAHIDVVIDSEKTVRQLVAYFGGTGEPPTDNIGLYVGEGMYVEDPHDALNYKGAPGRPGVDAPSQLGTTQGTAAEGDDPRINNGQLAYEYLVSQGLITE